MAKKKRTRRAAPPSAARQVAPSPWAPWPRLPQSPWLVVAPVLLFYALWLAIYVPRSHGGLDFMFIGQSFQKSHASSAIRIDPAYLATRDPTGYDGQFEYYIALDPAKARYYVDGPAYRYTRILYPLLARALALGQAAAIPYALILINWLAIGGGTLAVAWWLKRRGRSPWFALVYGFYPGLFISLTLDLTEPLGYALVALAAYLFDYGGRYRVVWAGLSFALAGLTRETTIIFAGIYGLALLLAKDGATTWRGRVASNWRRAASLLGVSLLPFALYKVLLQRWFGSSGLTDYAVFQAPLHGLFAWSPWQPWNVVEFRGTVIPALILTAMGLWALWKRRWTVAVWALLANVEVCVLGLTQGSYDAFYATARISTGVTLAALLCLPTFDSLTRRSYLWLNRSWLVLCAFFWLWLVSDWLGTMGRIYPS